MHGGGPNCVLALRDSVGRRALREPVGLLAFWGACVRCQSLAAASSASGCLLGADRPGARELAGSDHQILPSASLDRPHR